MKLPEYRGRSQIVELPVNNNLKSGYLTPTLATKPSELIHRLKLSQPDNDIVLAIDTSGSQAEPKSALISYNNIISHCRSFSQSISIDPDTVWLNCMPMNHIAGVMIVYRCWFYHAAMLLHTHFNVKKIWRDLHLYSISHLSLVPRMLFLLLEYQLMIQKSSADDHLIPDLLPKSLSYVIVGGDKLSDILYQRAVAAGWPLFISYGMTEATSTVAIGQHPEQLQPLDGFSIRINAQGTLSLKGDMVISSYANGVDKYCFDNGWFSTNDQVQVKGDHLQFLGRDDDMIISGGETIAPEYIESLFSAAPGISDLAITKYRDDYSTDQCFSEKSSAEWGDTIVALVCGDIKPLKKWSQDHIKPCYRPEIFVELDQIPRNKLYKIDRKTIAEILHKKFKLSKSH